MFCSVRGETYVFGLINKPSRPSRRQKSKRIRVQRPTMKLVENIRRLKVQLAWSITMESQHLVAIIETCEYRTADHLQSIPHTSPGQPSAINYVQGLLSKKAFLVSLV